MPSDKPTDPTDRLAADQFKPSHRTGYALDTQRTLDRARLGYSMAPGEAVPLAMLVEALQGQVKGMQDDVKLLTKWRERGCVLVPVTGELLAHEWSTEPLYLRIEDNGDGTHELMCMRVDPATTEAPNDGE